MPTLTRSSVLWTAQVIPQSSAVTSDAIDMSKADALALHLTSITGTSPDVTFTYQLSCDNSTWVTPVSPVTIKASAAAADVLDFAPEAALWIRIVATNNNASNAATISARLAIQEKH